MHLYFKSTKNTHWKMLEDVGLPMKLDAELHLNFTYCARMPKCCEYFLSSPLKWVNSPVVMHFHLKWNSSNFWIAAGHLLSPVLTGLIEVDLTWRKTAFTQTESITWGHRYYNKSEGAISTSLMDVVHNESLGCLHAADKQPAAK